MIYVNTQEAGMQIHYSANEGQAVDIKVAQHRSPSRSGQPSGAHDVHTIDEDTEGSSFEGSPGRRSDLEGSPGQRSARLDADEGLASVGRGV